MTYPPLVLRLRMTNAGKGGHLPRLRLWLPLFLIWPLVAAFLLLLSPIFLVCLAVGFFFFEVTLNPFELLGGCYGIVCGLRGTSIDVDSPVEGHHIQIDFK